MNDNNAEKDKMIPLSLITEQLLNTISVLKIDETDGDSGDETLRRQVLRGVFRPLVLYLVGHKAFPAGDSILPEDIIQAVIGQPGLELSEQLIKAVNDRYHMQTEQKVSVDWLTESLQISLYEQHPLGQLSQQVTGKLPEPLKRELTRTEM